MTQQPDLVLDQTDSHDQLLDQLSPAKRALLAQLKRGEHVETEQPIEATDQPCSALSPEQERIWALEELFPGTSQHNLAAAYSIQGDLDVPALEQALTDIIERHEPLRSAFRERNGERLQEPMPIDSCAIELRDLQDVDATGQADAVQDAVDAAANQHIDIASPPLCRATLIRSSATEHTLVLTVHHIVADGWSLGIFVRELSTIYTAIVQRRSRVLPAVSLRFRDCAEWLRRQQNSAEARAALDYHKGQLSGDLPVLDMPLVGSRPAKFRTGADTVRFTVDEALRADVERYASRNSTTGFSVLFAAWQILQFRFSGNPDLVTGSATSGRIRPEFDALIGCFFNTVAIRTSLVPQWSFDECVRRVSRSIRGAMDNQAAPFQDVVREVLKKRDPERAPVFQSMFAFQNAPIPSLELPGATVSRINVDMHSTQLDLTLVIDIGEGTYDANIWYCRALFDRETVTAFCNSFVELLRDALARPKTPLQALRLLPMAEREHRLARSSGPKLSVAMARVDDRILRIAEKTPDATAVKQAAESMSYADLVDYAHRLAYLLGKQGVSRGSRVAVLLERNIELPAVLLGIQLAGAAYVPLSDNMPTHRLQLILNDADVDALVVHRALLPTIKRCGHGAFVHVLEEMRSTADTGFVIPSGRDEADPVYVIYTSGTTGDPKGVEVSHRSLTNLLESIATYPGFGAKDTLVSQAALTFDMSPLEIFLPLCRGGSVEILPRDALRDPQLFLRRLTQSGATHLQATPSLLQMLLAGGWKPQRELTLWCGGEALPAGLAAKLLQHVEKLYNLYGPTECTVWTTVGRIKDAREIDVGLPIANARVYVIDAFGEPVPSGVIGEIVIAGDGVANGYIGRKANGDGRFADDSIFGRGRMYRSGDIGRRRMNGRIQILGRNDQQIKLRGYRIELGEIEAALSLYDEVHSSAVVLRQDVEQDRRITAYLAWVDGAASEKSASRVDGLREFLSTRLPGYMIPAEFIVLDELPLNENGKIDRRLLSQQSASPLAPQAHVEARSDLEQTLCDIWQSVLRLERVGVKDDFFKLGGHSILATQLLTVVEQSMGRRIEMQRLYSNPTIEGMAEAIEEQGVASAGPVSEPEELVADVQNAGSPFPLTEVQQAYLLGRSSAFDLGGISTHVYAEFDTTTLDVERLGLALNRLIARHGMLRAVFSNDARQRILPEVPEYEIQTTSLARLDSGASDENQLLSIREEMSHQVFDPGEWPLFDLRITDIGNRLSRLHVSIDLLIADAMSLQLLHRELFALYADSGATLPPLDISFRDYVLAREKRKSSPSYARCQEYWMDRLATIPPGPELPVTSAPETAGQPRFVRRQHLLSSGARQVLDGLCRDNGLTLPTYMLCVCAAVLSLWSKTSRFTINLPLLNRHGFAESLRELVGDFTSLLMLEVEIDPSETLLANAGRIQKRLWTDMEYCEYDGVSLLREISRQEGRHGSRLMPVVFTSALNLLDGPETRRRESQDPAIPQPAYAISQTSQAWLDCQLWEQEGDLVIAWDAIDDIFAAQVLDEMFRTYVDCLEAMSADAATLSMRDVIRVPEGQAAVRAATNSTKAPVREVLLHSDFSEQARKQPTATAIVCGQRRIGYGELDSRAAHIARQLAQAESTNGDFIAVCMEKGWEQIAAVLGVLYHGAAYVPIDAALPDSRILQLVELCGARITITQAHLAGRMSDLGIDTLVVDNAEWSGKGESDREQRDFISRPEDLAYLIFTSGSTGVPKGVMVSHRSAVNTIDDINKRFSIQADDRVLALSSLSFDLSVYDVFGLLSAGGTVVLPDRGREVDPRHWVELVDGEQVTVWNTVPALAQMYMDALDPDGAGGPEALRCVLLSGDWIPLNLAESLKLLLPDADVVSLGGATEASIWSIFYPIEKISSQWKSIPYGRALTNQSVHVLKADMSTAPDWTIGELYIGGEGVAQGYLKNPDKTRAQFVVHPDTGERLYRTGDLGRALPDGTIEFLGREDNQVKVFGHRIELGEIESALRKDDSIADCAVIATGTDRERRLVAYVVREDTAGADSSRWREQLRASLPDYMVPQLFMELERLPLTSNGKVDRRALPAPDVRAHRDREFVEPSSAMEVRLSSIWKNALRVDRIGVHETFFQLGGDSILAVQIASEIETDFGVHLPFKQLIASPTIAGIAEYLESLGVSGDGAITAEAGSSGSTVGRRDAVKLNEITAGKASAYIELTTAPAGDREAESIERVNGRQLIVADPERRYEAFPLTEVQQAFVLGRTNSFEIGNVSIHRYAEFDLTELDRARLSRACNRLVARHEMLRAVVRDDGWQVILQDVPEYKIPVQDLRGREAEEVDTALARVRTEMSHQVMSLSEWPPFDIRLTRLAEDSWRLHVGVDLVNFDARSLGILSADLSRFYADSNVELPDLEISFRDYVMSRPKRQRSKSYATAKAYWLERIDSLPSGPGLPVGTLPADIDKPTFVRRKTGLDREAWSSIKAKAAAVGVSPSTVLMSAFAIVVKRWSATARFTLNVTLSARPRHLQVDELVGDFTSPLLLEVNLSPTSSFAENASAMQRQLWNDLEHSDFTGVEVLREMNSRRGGAHASQMPVVFTFVKDTAADSGVGGGEFAARLRDNEVYAITQTPQVWLDHQIIDRDGVLDIAWDCVDELFERGVLDTMFDAFQELLQRLAAETSWHRPLSVSLPEAQDDTRRLVNMTQLQLEPDRLERLFERQAARRPDATAVIAAGHEISYGVLDRASRSIAHNLLKRGVQANELVAVVMDKGWEQIVAVLGILRAGAAYLPVDAKLPTARVHKLLEQAGANKSLVQESVGERLSLPSSVSQLLVAEPILKVGDVELPDVGKSLTDLAYVIFTSGSTGEPKGVMIDHLGAVNTVLDISRRFGVSSDDRILALSSLSFDLSVYDIFGLLGVGGTIVIPSVDRDPKHWHALIVAHDVTLWNSVPALAQMYLDRAENAAVGERLRLVMLSGDWIPPSLAARWRQLSPTTALISLGGATEASIWSIFHEIEGADESRNSIPYGKPLANQTFHVLDDSREDCPEWVPGDLHIGGLGLAKGYWRDAPTTETRFIVHPRYGRLYDTGDTGRYLPGGEIEFLGRRDSQIKLRGHRIEPSEIEAALGEHDDVHQAVVVIEQNGPRKQLAAHIKLKEYDQAAESSPEGAGWTLANVVASVDTSVIDEIESVEELDKTIKSQNALYRNSVCKALCDMGLFRERNESLSVEDVVLKGEISPRYGRWVGRALDHLTGLGLLGEKDGKYSRRAPLRELETSGEVLEDLMDILREDKHSAELYLHQSTEDNYQIYFDEAHCLGTELIQGLMARWDADQPVRVLEVGAGLGSLTRHLLPILKDRNVTYTFTDISQYFLNKAADDYAGYPFLEYELLDLDVDPTAQGFWPNSFDIVIASSVLHDVKDVDASLKHIVSLLKSRGVLLFVEETKFFPFFDLSMGLQQGFDVFTDRELRQAHPLMSRQAWRAAADRCGFREFEHVFRAGSFSEFFGLDVFVARSAWTREPPGPEIFDGFLRERLPDYMIPKSLYAISRIPLSGNGKVDREALAASRLASRRRSQQYIAPRTQAEKTLCQLWADNLELERIGIRDNYFENGGDSLLATRLISRVSASFEKEVPIRALFENPTIERFAVALDDISFAVAPDIPKANREAYRL